jgi:hypothetical protein
VKVATVPLKGLSVTMFFPAEERDASVIVAVLVAIDLAPP